MIFWLAELALITMVIASVVFMAVVHHYSRSGGRFLRARDLACLLVLSGYPLFGLLFLTHHMSKEWLTAGSGMLLVVLFCVRRAFGDFRKSFD